MRGPAMDASPAGPLARQPIQPVHCAQSSPNLWKIREGRRSRMPNASRKLAAEPSEPHEPKPRIPADGEDSRVQRMRTDVNTSVWPSPSSLLSVFSAAPSSRLRRLFRLNLQARVCSCAMCNLRVARKAERNMNPCHRGQSTLTCWDQRE